MKNLRCSLERYISNSGSKEKYLLFIPHYRLAKFLVAFPPSYLVENGFSSVTNLLTKKETDWKSLPEFKVKPD